MAEKESSSRQREVDAPPQRVSTELKLALIEHGLRPLAIALVGCLVLVWLWPLRESIEFLKVGPFEAKLREEAAKKDLQQELRDLEGLNNEQLELFLIIGKDRESETITYSGKEVSEVNLRRLEELGLLDWLRKNPDGTFTWHVSEKAYKLHQIIFDLVLESIRRLEDS